MLPPCRVGDARKISPPKKPSLAARRAQLMLRHGNLVAPQTMAHDPLRNAADAQAQSLSGRHDCDPAQPSGKSTPTSNHAGLAWPRLGGRSPHPLAVGYPLVVKWRIRRQPCSNAAPTLLLLIGKDGAARTRPLRRGAGRDRRADVASRGASLSTMPAFGTRGWTTCIWQDCARPNCARSEPQVADLL